MSDVDEIPYWLRCFRWIIRPFLTLFFSGLWGWAYLGFVNPEDHQDKLMGAIVMIVVTFWFGEKFVNRVDWQAIRSKAKEEDN